jgi:HSP20 family protein
MANRGLTPRNGSHELTPLQRDPFSIFRREMDHLFDEFFAAPTRRGETSLRGGWPSIDVEETEAAYIATAELPGMDPKDVELNLRDNVLTISGEKHQEAKSEEGGRRWTERSFGRFERTIPFGAEIDADRINASYRNGVLTVTLPKSAKAKESTRKIEIKPS